MRAYNTSEIEFIQERAAERILEVLDALGMDYNERRDYVQGPCPIHQGDNHRAWYWALNTQHWKCMTHHCEEDPTTGPSSSVFGLVRGVMSLKDGRQWGFQQVVDFVARVLGLTDAKVDPKTQEEMEIDRAIKAYRRRLQQQPAAEGVLLADVLPRLKPDTVYYPGRGISPEIIAKYHISYCEDPDKPFFERAFFPVLDESGRRVIGWSGRSIHQRCEKCRVWHPAGPCPPDRENAKWAKWRHSARMHKEKCLYNLWSAKPFIAKTGTAIVVEGPGDCWGYEAAGIKNSVSMLGLSLSLVQRQLLQRAGALTLVFTLDNDPEGIAAAERIAKDLIYYFRIFFLTPAGAKDIGELPPKDIQDQIMPVLERVSREGLIGDGYSFAA